MPASGGVPPPALPAGPERGLQAGPATRRLLPGVLLGPDAGGVRGGGGEPVVDGRAGCPDVLREGGSIRGQANARGGLGSARPGGGWLPPPRFGVPPSP